MLISRPKKMREILNKSRSFPKLFLLSKMRPSLRLALFLIGPSRRSLMMDSPNKTKNNQVHRDKLIKIGYTLLWLLLSLNKVIRVMIVSIVRKRVMKKNPWVSACCFLKWMSSPKTLPVLKSQEKALNKVLPGQTMEEIQQTVSANNKLLFKKNRLLRKTRQ